ncbi:HHL1-like protein [Myxacorys almedinensis]|uniref:Uncharacterized protein n=1 Tax=Myxacorys almedinensis A TaxID=2690445 RepID=A0A8J8CM04_9CYAN|nr:HHL1-like protein [Myxacorys almedinensis]NDJ18245.1 hypothetical protein [Myxacorys almedinensis A]
MTTPGFGKKVHKEKKQSQGTSKRDQASKQYDEFKSSGLPEYEIYMRVKDKKPWFPVGAIAVKRSSQINAAIYGNEEELLKGAFRLFPILRKNQGNLDYGYRLKEFKDEEIELATRPPATVLNGVQQAIAQVGDKVGSLFKKKD